MALAQTTNQILRSAGEGTEVIANSPITGNGTAQSPLGIDENWHGQDGESVTFTLSAIPSGTRVTLSGAQGTESFDVLNGANGTNGTDGAQGPEGPQGPQGVPGIQGPQGQQGVQGERGPQGEQGEQGIQGEQGPDGKSAYELAVIHGYVGSESQWLESLKGQDGVSPTVSATAIPSGTRVTITDAVSATTFDVMNGEQGPEGPSGAQGPSGASGFSPIVSTAAITTGTSGTQVTITDLTGSHSFNVMNGEQGPSGTSYTGSLMPLVGDNGIAVTSNAGNAIVELSSVAHDNTISGLGTTASPLGVVGGTLPQDADITPYSAGTNINITNHIVSGKDWNTEITAASSYAYNQATAQGVGQEYSAGPNIDITNHVISGKDWSTYLQVAGISPIEATNNIVYADPNAMFQFVPGTNISFTEDSLNKLVYVNADCSSIFTYRVNNPTTSYSSTSGLILENYQQQSVVYKRFFVNNDAVGDIVPTAYAANQYLTTDSQGIMQWVNKLNTIEVRTVATSGEATGSNILYVVTGS